MIDVDSILFICEPSSVLLTLRFFRCASGASVCQESSIRSAHTVQSTYRLPLSDQPTFCNFFQLLPAFTSFALDEGWDTMMTTACAMLLTRTTAKAQLGHDHEGDPARLACLLPVYSFTDFIHISYSILEYFQKFIRT